MQRGPFRFFNSVDHDIRESTLKLCTLGTCPHNSISAVLLLSLYRLRLCTFCGYFIRIMASFSRVKRLSVRRIKILVGMAPLIICKFTTAFALTRRSHGFDIGMLFIRCPIVFQTCHSGGANCRCIMKDEVAAFSSGLTFRKWYSSIQDSAYMWSHCFLRTHYLLDGIAFLLAL